MCYEGGTLVIDPTPGRQAAKWLECWTRSIVLIALDVVSARVLGHSLRGRRSKGKKKGSSSAKRELRGESAMHDRRRGEGNSPSPSPLNAGHAGYLGQDTAFFSTQE